MGGTPMRRVEVDAVVVVDVVDAVVEVVVVAVEEVEDDEVDVVVEGVGEVDAWSNRLLASSSSSST